MTVGEPRVRVLRNRREQRVDLLAGLLPVLVLRVRRRRRRCQDSRSRRPRSQPPRSRAARQPITSVDARCAVAPLAIAQDELLDLAGRRLRQRAELDGSGALKRAMRVRQCSINSSGVASAPSRSVTNAFGRSPQRSCGIATTAHSSTAGCAASACSTSIVEMFSPPEMITSLARSRSSIVPVGVPHREVAGVEPAAAEGVRRRLRIVVVAEHHVVAAHHDLAHRLAVARHVGVVLVDDAHEVGGRVRLALPGEHARAAGRVQSANPSGSGLTVIGP